MKKIAFVGNSAKTMYNFRFGVIKSCIDAGYDVTVIAVPDFDLKYYTSVGVKFIPIDIDCHGTHIGKDLITLWRLLAIYRRQQFDLIFHFTIKPVIYGSIAAKILHIKYIDVITGLGAVFIKQTYITTLVEKLYKHVLNTVCECWFLNNDDRQLFLNKRLIAPEKAIILHGEGINTTRFSPIKTDPPTTSFLYSGRLLIEKGIKEYVDAARIIRIKYPDITFNILGGFDDQSAISPQIMQQWVNEGIVTYIGETTNVIPYIANASCIVLPSYYREGIPRSLMEAAAMEKLIITTNTVGCKEVVQEGINGYICNIKDVDSLVECLEKVIALTPNERQLMGQQGRQFIIENYDERIIIDIYHKTLQRYLS